MISRTAKLIFDGFFSYKSNFDYITSNARRRFEARQWQELQADVAQRLYLHKTTVVATAQLVKESIINEVIDFDKWHRVFEEFSVLISERPDPELAYTFFTSVSRKVFPAYFQRVTSKISTFNKILNHKITTRYSGEQNLDDIVSAILKSIPVAAPYPLLEEDAVLVTAKLESAIGKRDGKSINQILVCDYLFYRNKTAYIAGKISLVAQVDIPFLIAMVNREQGLQADAVITTSEELDVIFGFTRSYFCVEARVPSQLVSFLQELMPQKRKAEIYNSLGFNKHGKTVLFNDLHQFMASNDEKLVNAPGVKGMVMAVFTFPSFNTVFKVIKDEFDPVKTVTHKEVLEKYRLVYKHDRYGRLADTHEFDNLYLDKSSFTPELLDELLSVAGKTIKLKDDKVVIRHTFTERKMVPLNIFIEENDFEIVKRVVVDFGNALKELAQANIFPGDLLMKNFGVTIDNRVVFYDYDEITFVTSCNFRKLPVPETIEELYASEPRYQIKPNDIFPEEFKNYLVPQGPLRDVFVEAHPDLFEVEFWEGIKTLHQNGKPFEIIAYDKKNCLR